MRVGAFWRHSARRASATCTNCRPRWTKPLRSRPDAACDIVVSTSVSRNPARSARTVRPTSTPYPAENGRTVARQDCVSARCPESGACASKSPPSRAIPKRARPFTRPNPALPAGAGKAAIAMSAVFASKGAVKSAPCEAASPRSPSRSSTMSASSTRLAPASSAAPLPCEPSNRTTLAPAFSASWSVSSSEPSSMTMTRVTPGMPSAALTV